MQTFNINDGLVSNQVRGFYQDQKGFIWILTWEGLSRHDGYAFRNYTIAEGLAHPLINAMIEGKDGRMYIAENNGTVDVILNGKVRSELRKSDKNTINKLIREPSGRILAPTDDIGVCAFDEGSVFCQNTAAATFTVLDVTSKEDVLFVCGTKSGVMHYDHTFLKQWRDTLTEYKCVVKDQSNRIWVGTSKGLRWVNLTAGDATRYDLMMTSFEKEPWSQWIIQDFLQTSDGSIWVAAIGGLIQIKPDQSWRVYDRYDGLPSDYITSIFEDKSGFLWVGSDQGIAQLDINNTIDIFTIAEDLPNTVPGDIQPTMDGGALIISGQSAVFRIKLNQPLMPIHLPNNALATEFLIVGNDTLVTTDKGRYTIRKDEIRLWTEVPYAFTQATTVMKNGCIFSTATHTIRINCRDGQNYTDTTMNDMIYSLAVGKEGEIWVGTLNLGVFQARVRNSASGSMDLEWKDFNTYLPEKTIRSLHADAKGNIWIGTRYSGLVRLYQNALTGEYATQIFDRSDGFISDFIKSITSDEEGNIWIGTHAGIEKLIPTKDGYRPFSFSRVHNFFATVVDLAVGLDNTIWCSTTSGIVRIKDNKYETRSPSEVYITSVSTAKNTLIDPQSDLPFDLRYNENFIDIGFSSNDHINGKQIAYSYRLKGSQDTSWSTPLPMHNVSFANLLPGDYHFEVRMLGWNETLGETKSYHFRIRPPFWQRTWFMLLSFLALLGLLYLFYRYRILQLKRIQEVRDRIASDLHDEIGSSLTHVNILSEIGKKTSGPEDQPQQLFRRIGEEVQSSSEALDDIIWSVSSRADTTEDLISRMRRYASELFGAKGIAFMLRDEHLDGSQTLGLEVRRDFYLIFKELLRNIVRHAGATDVQILIFGERQFLRMTISDNGHGFDPKAPSDRHGLHSIKGRVSKWKGFFSIDSSPGKGTRIEIGLPAKTNLYKEKG